MLVGLSKGLRLRAALALAAAYAFCILAPQAAIAFGGNIAHCLMEANGLAHVHHARFAPKAHTHTDGVIHVHAGEAIPDDHGAPRREMDGKTHSGNCCGLFCSSAIALDADTGFNAPAALSPIPGSLPERLVGRGPDRLIRPPIA